MVEYSTINCKLTNVQLNKLKKAVKSNEGTTLRLGIKNFNKNELRHELLLTTRQNTKLRNAINNNFAIIKPKYTIYFDSFGIEHIPKEINKFIRSKELGSAVGNNDTTKSSATARIKSNIIRIQA